ncbi:MAG: AAA family ATPase [Dysosmobacter sp.]
MLLPIRYHCGLSIYNKDSGCFEYKSGVVGNTNLLLGDEINRTSSKTQSALLEAMEERQVTVDGTTYPLQKPFAVIATQNDVGYRRHPTAALCPDGPVPCPAFHRLSRLWGPDVHPPGPPEHRSHWFRGAGGHP